jgi:molybdopterin-containing oxidoreductase family iron-sulfur binding subunit
MKEPDLAPIRARLAGPSGTPAPAADDPASHAGAPVPGAAPPAGGGREMYWRSLDELAETPEFQELLHREFPERASEFTDPTGRREFLKLMGASLALAGAAGCTRQPPEKILPYTRQPEEMVPGRPLFFATAMPFAGAATPMLVESHMGRPTKVEPNPEHPAVSVGSDVFAQAAILTLYDPDRSRTVKRGDDILPWGEFLQVLQGAMNAQRALKGAGLRLLTETVVSPTLADQIARLLAELPEARWVQWEPVSRDHVREGARLAFGEVVEPQYRFDRAEVVLSLDADFLHVGPARLRHARDFAARRRLVDGQTSMSRLYVVESTPTGTGVKADHRLPLKAGLVEAFARAVAAALGVAGAGAGAQAVPGVPEGFIAALVEDLRAHRGASLVIAGEQQPPAVHALAHAMNEVLGNAGATVVYTPPIEARPASQLADLRALAAEMEAGTVDLLVIVGEANPVYSAPADVAFAERLQKVGLRVHLGLYEDETARLCHWHVPMTHFLEAWGDARAFDGTVSICQPLIAPLYEAARSAHELLLAMIGPPARTAYDEVRDFWRRQWERRAAGGPFGPLARPDGGDHATFEDFWRQSVHDGFIAGSAFAPKPVALRADAIPPAGPAPAADRLELTFRPDPKIWDGRFANNGWLQELPAPVSKVTWDNVAVLSPATAERLGVRSGYQRGVIGTEQATDVVEIRAHGRQVRLPAWIVPGQPDGSVMVTIGYGRTRAGRVGDGVGRDVNALRPSHALWVTPEAEVVGTGESHPIACTQHHFAIEGRAHLRAGTLARYRGEPEFARHMAHAPGEDETLYGNPWKYEGHAWGMSVDLNACTGCNACVVACQSENNIPVVGKAQVLRQREMHWIRIDRYYAGSPDSPDMYFQPMMCHHCENAPCEVVCPVAATVHSSEGLNDMVYNRCVGTRYCSNNCPYKVRRFNFLLFADWTTPTLKMARNPDVTVRSRGVMEKCTYCVQRINQARIDAKREDRPIRDGDIVTACEAACPAQAIVFGDVNDPASRVAKLKQEPRSYGALAELNVRPRTTYLAAVRNPNPALAPEAPAAGHEPAH